MNHVIKNGTSLSKRNPCAKQIGADGCCYRFYRVRFRPFLASVMFYWWSKCSTRLLCARSSENRCVRMIWWRRRLLDPISSGGCDSAAKNIIVGVLLLYVLLDLVCASFSMTHRLLTSGVTCFWVPVNRKRKGNPAVMNTGPKSTRWDLWVRKAFYRLLLSYRASHATRMMLEKNGAGFLFLFFCFHR